MSELSEDRMRKQYHGAILRQKVEQLLAQLNYSSSRSAKSAETRNYFVRMQYIWRFSEFTTVQIAEMFINMIYDMGIRRHIPPAVQIS